MERNSDSHPSEPERSDSDDGTPEAERGTVGPDPAEDVASEPDAPAGFWGKLLLTATPFAAIALLFLLDRCISGP